MRKFPSLVNCVVIDWFQPWPEEALASVSKRFLEKEMPDIVDFLHYRMIDVSTVKELARRWYFDVPRYEKKGAHLALDDIRESVEELRYFRERVFR